MASSRLHEFVGRVVGGRYRLTAPLGSGASARVFLADDVRLGRQVALKMLHPVLADDERFLRRFRAEAQAAASLTHPNILAVHDWGDDDVPYLVTEYLGGGSLRAVLDAGTRLTPSQALVVGLDAATGLAHAHSRGFVHRDIKPANLLFGDDGRLCIGDFGLARALAEASVTEPEGAMVGTARYASPEQAQGLSVDGKADVYALALVLVEAVTGRVPFQGETTIATLMARLESDLDVPDDVGAIASAVAKAGVRDLDERSDAEEFRILLLTSAERLPAPEAIPLVDPVASARSVVDEDARTHSAPLPFDDAPTVSVFDAPTVVEVSDDTPDTEAVDLVDDGDGEETQRRRRWPWVALFALLAVALVGGGIVVAGSLGTDEFEVPALVGRQADDVDVIAAQNDWEVVTRKGRRDGTTAGEILSTDPPAGERLPAGGTLTLIVSEGNELTTAPEGLVGVAVADALAAIDDAGLVADVTESFDEDVAAGVVISVADLPLQVARGDTVALVVSLGPAPRVVPAFVADEGVEPIAAALTELRLVPVVVEVFDDEVPAGVVLDLTPAAGVEVARGTEIEIRVSKGPELVAVPDIRELSLADARARLESAGLALGQQCCSADGTVIETDPSAGTLVAPGTAVNVFLRR